MKVIVLGAGVIGVTTAYFLAKAGHQVTVLEKNPASSMGCSYANGGQLSYSHIEPWASKSSIISFAKAAFCPSSFLSISDFFANFFDRDFFKWSMEFCKNAKQKKNQENSKKLFALSGHSKTALEEIMREETGLKFNYNNTGILHFFKNQKKFDAAIKEAEVHNAFGCKAQILNKDECVKKEPTLVKLYDENKLLGGIFYEMDASGDSLLFTKALEKICREKYGVIFEYNTDVRNIFNNRKKITGINTNRGVFVANKYVYALGAYGNKLLSGIGINPKIYPLKGYSLSLEANREFIAPNLALTDSENKVVYSRIGDVFRVAGTIEICSAKNNNNQKNIEFLKDITKSSFSDFGNFNNVKTWFGFRPFRPNSIPLICEAKKYENFLINAGHGSLGWTLAAGSAKIAADLVADKKSKKFEFLEEEEKGIYI